MIYLDYSSTSPIDEEVFQAMLPFLTAEYGNPSSKYYPLATHARDAVEEARECVAALINAKPEEIVFTGSGTESTNMIIKGVADYLKHYELKGNHLITSKAEHKATLNTCKFLNGEIYSNRDATFSFSRENRRVDRGYEVTFLEVNEYGQVEPELLRESIRKATTLVSIIWGNNEVGTLNDVHALGTVCRERKVAFHSDATQVLGKVRIDVEDTLVDFLTMAAHKLYGPKGIGAAYIRGDDYGLPPLTSLIHGGEQEDGLRGGTLAVHNIVGFGKAAEIALRDLEKREAHLRTLEGLVITGLSKFPQIRFLGKRDHKVPGIISFIVDSPNFNNERFLRRVSDRVALSTGSACALGKPSHVLQAIGMGEYTSRVLRLSLGKDTTEEQIHQFLAVMGEEL